MTDITDLADSIKDGVRELALENERLRGKLGRVTYALKIYVHAFDTDNAVPPHIVEQAKAALREREGK